HFVSDLHGEFQAFQHVLRNGSGNVRQKITDIFKDTLSEEEISQFAALVYYPEEKLQLIRNQVESKKDLDELYVTTTDQMIELIAYAFSKYTRSKLRKALAEKFVFIIEELLYESDEFSNKKPCYVILVQEITGLGQADELIIGMSYTIQRL